MRENNSSMNHSDRKQSLESLEEQVDVWRGWENAALAIRGEIRSKEGYDVICAV
jgi:hypothetical protein